MEELRDQIKNYEYQITQNSKTLQMGLDFVSKCEFDLEKHKERIEDAKLKLRQARTKSDKKKWRERIRQWDYEKDEALYIINNMRDKIERMKNILSEYKDLIHECRCEIMRKLNSDKNIQVF